MLRSELHGSCLVLCIDDGGQFPLLLLSRTRSSFRRLHAFACHTESVGNLNLEPCIRDEQEDV